MSGEPLDPESLRDGYRAFLRPGRVLLTGHSHQAWPDVAREGLVQSFADAAEHVDDKWSRAMAKGDRVRQGVVHRLGGRVEDVALGESTHGLVCRFLSALDLRARPRIVTTTGEFHSVHRQLRRLEELGLEVAWVDATDAETLAARLATAVDERTAAVLVSSVLYATAAVVPGIPEAVEAAHRVGAEVLVDAYHAFNVVPERLEDLGPDPIYVTGGGYKYAQWGEGCAYLRTPPDCALRPVYTGWFADFEHLEDERAGGPVGYGPRNADRFAGATYDAVSHYRAAAVLDFFDERGLDVGRLRALSLRQTARIIAGLDALGAEVLTPRPDARRGGFVAVRVPDAAAVVRALREEGVFTDARGDVLRLGPAPYVTDDEIDRGVAALGEALKAR